MEADKKQVLGNVFACQGLRVYTLPSSDLMSV